MCSANKADACKKEYGAKGKENNYLFYVAGPGAAVHEINGAKDETGNAKECEYYSYNSFFHNQPFKGVLQRVCL
jgi:hypothetical protein